MLLKVAVIAKWPAWLTFSLMVSEAEVCLRKTLAIPILKDLSSGIWRVISDVMRWQPLEGAVIVTVRCAQAVVPVLSCWRKSDITATLCE